MICHDEFRPASPYLSRNRVANPRRLRLGEGVRASAQRNVRFFEPLTDVVVEGELNQADWIHWWDKGGNRLDRMFPNLIEVVPRGNGKEQSPVFLRRPSLAATATNIRVERGRRLLPLPVIEMVQKCLKFIDGHALK